MPSFNKLQEWMAYFFGGRISLAKLPIHIAFDAVSPDRCCYRPMLEKRLSITIGKQKDFVEEFRGSESAVSSS